MKLCRAGILDVKLPARERSTPEKERNEQWKELIEEAAKEIQESRKPFEDTITEKQNKLELLENYSSAFSDNKIVKKICLWGLTNIMAMRGVQTQFGEKYTMLLATDQNGTLGLCYSNKEIERYMQESVTEEVKEKMRDHKCNSFTLFGKPLAVLNITGWGRTQTRYRLL